MKTVKELLMVRMLPEILDLINLAPNRNAAKEVLKKNESPALKLMLQFVFYPGVEFYWENLPNYTEDVGGIGLSPATLFQEMHRVYIFTKCNTTPFCIKQVPKFLNDKRRMELLVQMLETLHPSESNLLGKIFKRDLQTKYLDYDFVREVFPSILPCPV